MIKPMDKKNNARNAEKNLLCKMHIKVRGMLCIIVVGVSFFRFFVLISEFYGDTMILQIY